MYTLLERQGGKNFEVIFSPTAPLTELGRKGIRPQNTVKPNYSIQLNK